MRYLTREQSREIDRRALEQYHIPGIVLMENASRAVAEAAIEMLRNSALTQVLILCGGGNNGGDGLAAARHLYNRGVHVRIGLTTDPARYTGDALVNWKIVEAMRIPCSPIESRELELKNIGLVIDAIFGTGLTKPPREPFPMLVAALAESKIPVLSVDLPSGLDCNTGQPLGACIRATRTVTFVAAKSGFAQPAAKEFIGEVIIGDIGCPRELIELIDKFNPM